MMKKLGKIAILFLLFMVSCVAVRHKQSHPIGSKWYYITPDKQDTSIVWVSHYSILEGIIVKDGEFVGSVKPEELIPLDSIKKKVRQPRFNH